MVEINGIQVYIIKSNIIQKLENIIWMGRNIFQEVL